MDSISQTSSAISTPQITPAVPFYAPPVPLYIAPSSITHSSHSTTNVRSIPFASKSSLSIEDLKLFVRLQYPESNFHETDDYDSLSMRMKGHIKWCITRAGVKCFIYREYKLIIYGNGTRVYYKNEMIHRDDDLPAIMVANGNLYWYQRNSLHRDGDKPAIIITSSDIYHWRNDCLVDHREFFPDILYVTCKKIWYQNGRLHRDVGPAVILPDGSCYWYKYGVCHREDGPAIELANGENYNVVMGIVVFEKCETVFDFLPPSTLTEAERDEFSQYLNPDY